MGGGERLRREAYHPLQTGRREGCKGPGSGQHVSESLWVKLANNLQRLKFPHTPSWQRAGT